MPVRDLELRTAGMALTTCSFVSALREGKGPMTTYHACYLKYLAADSVFEAACVAARLGGWVAGGKTDGTWMFAASSPKSTADSLS